MSKFTNVPDILTATEDTTSPEVASHIEEAFRLRSEQNSDNLVPALVRVFGRPGIPVMVDLATRSVYPTKA